MAFLYFTLEYAIRAHDKVLEVSGGIKGFRDLGLLESIIDHVKNDTYYPTFEDKLTHIVYSVAMNHAFIDGNKRSALALGSFLMNMNGYSSQVGTFMLEMEDILVMVADNRVSKELLHNVICSLIYQGDISEEVKIEILNSIK